jgi:phosphatidylinositol alpha-mannosyltransferase
MAAAARPGASRIALLTPTYWPEVRRGTERLVHDLGALLAERGHEVTLITSHRGPADVTVEDGVRVDRVSRPRTLPPLRWYEPHLETLPAVIRRLLRDDYDVCHAFFPSYAWGAVRARALGGPPVVFSFHGIPVREYLVERRYRLEMLRTAVDGAAVTTVLSEAAADPFRRYLLRDPAVLPGGVFCDRFAVEAERAPEPTLVCAASLGDPRKGAETLFAGIERLRERRPDARLLLVRSRDPVMSYKRVVLPEGASWIEADRTEELARAYASAWASVLPATGEAFGLVLVESLAAGTPVVAARSGAAPEIVTGDGLGRLFEPGDGSALADAIDETFALREDDESASACRARAAEYDWEAVLPAYEDVYLRARSEG